MKVKLQKFIYSEQVKNNYSLYKNDNSISFILDIPEEYKPASQKVFKIGYFLIPLGKDKIQIDETQKEFFEKHIFIDRDGVNYYPFFVHPTSEKIFTDWIAGKYEFISPENSLFEATPTSSYRSLVVKNILTKEYFIVKVSIFGNVANGARQIDWTSADGQFFFSKCTANIAKNIDDFSMLRDIGAFGITGDYPIHFSKKYNITYGPNKIKSFGNVIRRLDNIFDDNEETAFYSIVALTSVVDKNDCYFQKIYLASGKDFEDFFINDFIMPIFEKFFEIFSQFGISLECHCQNTLIEISKDWKFTGHVVYRDFDITSLDRARFPFLFPDEWKEYCRNRLDRTSLYSNLSAREETGKNFFAQFIGSLVNACLLCAVEMKIISSEQSKQINKRLFDIFVEKSSLIFPLYNRKLNECSAWPYGQNIYKDIDISEIPVQLLKISSFDEDLYEKFWVNSPELEIDSYYKTEQDYILGFSNNIFTSLYMKRELENECELSVE